MFDIGFPELLVITLVALLVIGPERLPEAVRTVTLWIGRIRRSFNRLRQEIEAEIDAEGLKRQLREDKSLQEVKQLGQQVRGLGEEAQAASRQVDQEVRSLQRPPKTDGKP